MAEWQFGTLTMFGYDVIVPDPPWDFENYSDAGTKKGADPHYSVMRLEAIKALSVHELARGDCLLLLLWTTGWAIATGQAQEVARAWGFKPISEIVWLKRYPSGKARVGTGYLVRTMHDRSWSAPSVTRSTSPSRRRSTASRVSTAESRMSSTTWC
jgi:N6-adenosine-specific RNA methylase IME4